MSFAEFCQGIGRQTLVSATWSSPQSVGDDLTLGSFAYAFEAYISHEAFEILKVIYNAGAAAHAAVAAPT
eukprot:COSAG02_NODE_3604_length_6492_cov_3.323166_6_plen_70_part_00